MDCQLGRAQLEQGFLWGNTETYTWVGDVSVLSVGALIRACLLDCTLGSKEWDLRFLSSSAAHFKFDLYDPQIFGQCGKQPVLRAEVSIKQAEPSVVLRINWLESAGQPTNEKVKAFQKLIWLSITQRLSQLSRSTRTFAPLAR